MAVGVVAVELGILVLTVLPPGVQDFDGPWVEVDRPARRAGLAPRFVEFVADGHERASDGEMRGVEVDVTPSEAEYLAASHAGVGGDPQRGVVAVIACRCQECPELLGVPHARRVARQRPSLRGVGDLGRVAEDPTAADGVIERSTQDHVDLHDGLVVEPSRAVGASVVEQVGVQALEVIGTQMPQRDPPDSRDEMEVDDSPVGVPRARPQDHLLGRQPALGQIHSNREAGSLMASAPPMSIGEIACQRSRRLLGRCQRDATAGAHDP